MTRSRTPLIAVLLSALALSACAPDESGLWREFQARQKSVSSRRPAQAGARCFSDRLQSNALTAEVADMQDALQTLDQNGQVKPTGQFRFGKNEYRDLHPAIIDFLSQRSIADTDSQAGCTTGDCFLQQLYPAKNSSSPDSMESLIHYWFFLKTGVAMSAQSSYPWYQGSQSVRLTPSGTELQQYLFDGPEWQAWWKLAHLLPPSMQNLASLQTVHRVPRGTHPPEWKSGVACGLSAGSWNSGLAVFDEDCLELSSKAPMDPHTSPFFAAATHEFAHRLSSSAHNRGPARTKVDLDETPDFLQLSGWRKNQLVTPDGKVEVQWESSQKAQFVSSFARINPAEDFAESVGQFRANPSHVRELAKAKYDFIKSRVYNSRGFAPAELQQYYADTIVQSVLENAGAVLEPCLPNAVGASPSPSPRAVNPARNTRTRVAVASPSPSPSASPSPAVAAAPVAPVAPVTVPALTQPQYRQLSQLLQIQSKMDSTAQACVRARVLNQIAEAVDDLRYSEPEACGVLGKMEGELEIVEASLKTLSGRLMTYLKGDLRIVDLSKVLETFRKAMDADYDPRVAVLSCWRQANPRACYSARLESEMAGLLSRHGATVATVRADSGESEKTRFLREHSYDVALGQTTRFYETLMAPQFARIPTQAEAIWDECRGQKDSTDLTTVKLEPYHAGAGYLPASVLNCLNQALSAAEFPNLRAQAGAEHAVAVVAPEAREWIDQKILLPRFKAVLDQKVAAMHADDQKRFEAAKDGSVDSISEAMIKEFAAWQPEGRFQYKTCKSVASQRLTSKFKADEYRFLALGPELDPVGNQICERVRLSAAAQAGSVTAQTTARTSGLPTETERMPANLIEPTPDALYKKILPVLLKTAQSRHEECRQPQYKSKRLRRYCLLTEWVDDDQDQSRKNAWAYLRDRAVRTWLKDPEVAAYRQSKGYPESALFEAVQARVDLDSMVFIDALLSDFKAL